MIKLKFLHKKKSITKTIETIIRTVPSINNICAKSERIYILLTFGNRPVVYRYVRVKA